MFLLLKDLVLYVSSLSCFSIVDTYTLNETKVGTWTEALLKTSKQSTLSFAPITPNAKTAASLSVDFKSNGTKTSQQALVAQEALKVLGECILLNEAYINLFDRLSLVYHRKSTSSSGTTALTNSLLARFGKRTYPNYEVKRSYSIFPDRKTLKDFELAVEIERKMEEALGDYGWSTSSDGRDRKGKKVTADAVVDIKGEEDDGEFATPRPRKNPKTKEGQSAASVARSLASTRIAEEKKLEREKGWKDSLAMFEEYKDLWSEMCISEKIKKKGLDKDALALVYYRKRFHPGSFTSFFATYSFFY